MRWTVSLCVAIRILLLWENFAEELVRMHPECLPPQLFFFFNFKDYICNNQLLLYIWYLDPLHFVTSMEELTYFFPAPGWATDWDLANLITQPLVTVMGSRLGKCSI